MYRFWQIGNNELRKIIWQQELTKNKRGKIKKNKHIVRFNYFLMLNLIFLMIFLDLNIFYFIFAPV